MKILTLTAFLVSGLATTASAALVDQFTLDVTTAAGTDSNIVLELGQEYEVTVSGQFWIGPSNSWFSAFFRADAEYINLLGSSGPVAGSTFGYGVGIDGLDVDFGAYSVGNIYSTTVIGDGSTINVSYNDTNYTDNSGNLSVSIETEFVDNGGPASVPLPAGFPLILTSLSCLAIARRRKG